MLQYDLAKLRMTDFETKAARARARREVESHGRPLRAVIGRRLVRIGLRLAAAQG